MRTGVMGRQQEIIERRDGSSVPIIPYPTPLYDEKGAIAGVINMTVDIRERKKAEVALAERNAQFALWSAAMPMTSMRTTCKSTRAMPLCTVCPRVPERPLGANGGSGRIRKTLIGSIPPGCRLS